jgi:hypothetical protein
MNTKTTTICPQCGQPICRCVLEDRKFLATKVGQLLRGQHHNAGTEPVSIEEGDSDERYSPPWLADGARAVMGGIDVDVASCAAANETVQAHRYFTRQEDGLAQTWAGRVFWNPPYAGGIRIWIEKLNGEMQAGRVRQATLVFPADMLNAITTTWFKPLLAGTLLVPCPRIRFFDPQGRGTGPRFGAVVIYLGSRQAKFLRVFGGRGTILRPQSRSLQEGVG